MAEGSRIRFAPNKSDNYEVVDVFHENAASGSRSFLFCLVYPSQGQIIGDERRSVEYAKLLNEAAEPLNECLARLTGERS